MYGTSILLPVRVNGSAPVWFIFDTGAEPTIIDRDRVQALGLKLPQGEKIKGIALDISGTDLPEQTIYVEPLSRLEARFGRHIDGIIGYALLSRFTVELDYAAKVMTLTEPAVLKSTGEGQPIPIRLKEGLPDVKAKIIQEGRAPVEGEFVLDTGASHAVSLNSPFVKANRLLEYEPQTIPSVGFDLAAGESPRRIGRLKVFRLGSYSTANPIVNFSQATKGDTAESGYAGELGAEVLRRFTVTLDYTHKLVSFEPNEHFAEPYEFNMSGLSISSEGADFRTFTINRVLENSPAAEAGLRAGDLLLAVDDRAAAQLDS